MILDEKIVKQCQNNELEKFELLYEKYVKKIYNFIYYKTLHKETAEDLTSQTFIKALNNINKFKTGQGGFSAWLYRIARNNIVDNYRKQKIEIDINDVWDLGSFDNIQGDIDNIVKLEKVKKYLQKIVPEQREIIFLRVWEDLSYKEISEITGKTEANCKMIFSRVMAKTRKELIMLIISFLLLT